MKEVYTETYSITDLKSRGWTDAGIRRFLGEPDEVRKNFYRGITKLYDEGRIVEAEQSQEFLDWTLKNVKRRAAAKERGELVRKENELKKASEQKEAIEFANTAEIVFPKKWTNQKIWYETKKDNLSACEGAERCHKDRWIFNYLRHYDGLYDWQCDVLGPIDHDGSGYVILAGRWGDAIISNYPYLKEAEENWRPQLIEDRELLLFN